MKNLNLKKCLLSFFAECICNQTTGTQSLLQSARHFAPACTLSIDTARTGSRPGPLGSQNDIATVTPAMRLKIE